MTVGQQVRLPCPASAAPHWSHEGFSLDVNMTEGLRLDDEGALLIESVQEKDAGDYVRASGAGGGDKRKLFSCISGLLRV